MDRLVARHPEYNIRELCELLGKTKQAYYKRKKNTSKEVMPEPLVVDYAKAVRSLDPGIGCWKIWYGFNHNSSSVKVGRDRFLDILYRNNLRLRMKRRGPRTTDSRHNLPLYPNIVKDLLVSRPNQLWVSDITYITIWRPDKEKQFCYLSLVMDDYTKEIIGYVVSDTLEVNGCIAVLKMAIRNSGVTKNHLPLIHHSDRGVQYASAKYTDMLKNNSISISMTEDGNPKDNASAERVNNTVKNELLRKERFTDLEHVRSILNKRIKFYNERRPHMSIGMLTPRECRGKEGVTDKKWERKREKYLRKENIET